MKPLVAAVELVNIVGLRVKAAVAVADVETVVERAVAVVAITEGAAAECVGSPHGGAKFGAKLRFTEAGVDLT
jgi:hypothetical protein